MKSVYWEGIDERYPLDGHNGDADANARGCDPECRRRWLILAQEMMSMEQIGLLMAVVSAIVLFICIYGFIRFVRWGQRDKDSNSDPQTEDSEDSRQ